MADAAFLLELRGVRKSFGVVEVLQGVDFQLKRGEIHALLGQNGAGKSTLMKLIDGVHQRDGGEMLIELEAGQSAFARGSALARHWHGLSRVQSHLIDDG